MKKILVALLILIAVGAGIYFSEIWQRFFQTDVDLYFPQDSILYLKIHNVREAYTNLQKTLLWQKIQASPRKQEYRKLVLRIQTTLESFLGLDPALLADQFQGTVAVAVFRVSHKGVSGGLVAEVRGRDTKKFIEQEMDPVLKRQLPDLRKKEESYNGVKYFRYESNGFKKGTAPCYFLSGKWFIASMNQEGMQRLIEIKKNPDQSIRENPRYKSGKKNVDYQKGFLAYLDAPNAIRALEGTMPARIERFWPPVARVLGLYSIESVLWSTRIKEEGFQETAFLEIRKDREGILKTVMNQKPMELEAIHRIPQEMSSVTAMTLPDLAGMWDEVDALLNRVLTPDQYRGWESANRALGSFLNFDARRDLLAPLGSEMSFSAEPATGWNSQLPSQWILVLQLENPDKMEETIERLSGISTMIGAVKKQEHYKGKIITTFTVQKSGYTVQPSYLLDGEWLFWAGDSALLKRSLDTYNSKQSIATTSDFERITRDFPSRVNALSYSNVGALLKKYSSMVRETDSEMLKELFPADRLAEEMNYLGQNLYGSARYWVIQEKGIFSRTVTSIPTLMLFLPAVVTTLSEIVPQGRSL